MSRPVLWLDSDVARSVRQTRQLAELARTKEIRVVVAAQVHLEQCRQVRENAARRGVPFVPQKIDELLRQTGIDVEPTTFDRITAEAWAELLHARYPGEAAWRQAKLDAVKARLPEATTPDRVPMATDWLVALEVERSGGFIAVNDQGPEWRHLRAHDPPRAMRFEEALAWLKAQPEPPSPR